MKIKQTAGRDSLGEFAPKFAELNDDVLFGEIWSSDGISLKTRSIITITTLIAKGITDSSLKYHLQTAKKNGACDTCGRELSQETPEIKPDDPEKDGLSGGAIAGIAVAGVAVAGMGGFAIFWFVIKKKTIADLIAIFKKK